MHFVLDCVSTKIIELDVWCVCVFVCVAVAKSGLKGISNDVERCLSLVRC